VHADLTWESPGPGWWFLAREHLPTPVPRLYSALLPHATRGWTTSSRRYGQSRGNAQWAAVNGWMYYGPRAADPSTFDALEIAAEETLRTFRWRDDVRRWHDVDRPAFVTANLALQDEDPESPGHVRRLLDHYRAIAPRHFELHTAFSIGGGWATEQLQECGLSLADVLPLLAGSSPASARARGHVDAIVAEVGDRAVSSLDDVRGPALAAYLREYGWRCLDQHELGEALIERPDVIVASVRARQSGHGGAVPAPDVEAVRSRASDGERFDVALADLRDTYGLNDDNVGITFGWPLGLMRRAVLDLGRRRGWPAGLGFHADPDELVALAEGDGPAVEELQARAAAVEAAGTAEPPEFFAGEAEPEHAVSIPEAVQRVDRLATLLWATGATTSEPLTGVGIGDTAYRGRACRVDDDTGTPAIEPGDVLIARVTHAGHNSVFPIAGAVATELGGPLSHPAVLARELGLPAVVGVRELLAHVRTGDVVEVDPVAGVIRVVG